MLLSLLLSYISYFPSIQWVWCLTGLMLKGLWCEAPSRPKDAARRCSKEWPEPQIRQGGYSTICPFPGSLGGGLSGWFSDNDYPIWNGNLTILLIFLAGSVAAAARCYNLAWGWAMNGWVSGIIVTSRFCPVGSPFCSISDCSWMALRPHTWWASKFLSLLWPNITPCYVNFNVYGPPSFVPYLDGCSPLIHLHLPHPGSRWSASLASLGSPGWVQFLGVVNGPGWIMVDLGLELRLRGRTTLKWAGWSVESSKLCRRTARSSPRHAYCD